MKEIVAIIRPNKMIPTKQALDKINSPSITALSVLGRGYQKGIAEELNINIAPVSKHKVAMKFIPKRMLFIVVEDSEVDLVIDTLIKTNQTGQIGDGKIFVCPVDDVIRIRTGETGDNALK